MTSIQDMSLDDLKKFVEQTVDERLTALLGRFEIDEETLFPDAEPDTRTWAQVKQDIERDRWTPPPGAKSSLELLREDRDS